MWDDFKIGDLNPGNTTVCVNNYENLSQNQNCYWWDNGIISGKIDKNTAEGKIITNKINKNVPNKNIDDYIFLVGIKYMEPQNIIKLINRIEIDSFEKGRVYQAEKIRSVINFT